MNGDPASLRKRVPGVDRDAGKRSKHPDLSDDSVDSGTPPPYTGSKAIEATNSISACPAEILNPGGVTRRCAGLDL